MVLQLAQSVEAFLHKYNVPNVSFHEQMLKNMQRNKEKRIKEAERKLAKDKAQAKELDDDVVSEFNNVFFYVVGFFSDNSCRMHVGYLYSGLNILLVDSWGNVWSY